MKKFLKVNGIVWGSMILWAITTTAVMEVMKLILDVWYLTGDQDMIAAIIGAELAGLAWVGGCKMYRTIRTLIGKKNMKWVL